MQFSQGWAGVAGENGTILLLLPSPAQRCFPSAGCQICLQPHHLLLCVSGVRGGAGGHYSSLATRESNSCITRLCQPPATLLSMSESWLSIKINQWIKPSHPIPKPTTFSQRFFYGRNNSFGPPRPEHQNKMWVFFIKPLISSGS